MNATYIRSRYADTVLIVAILACYLFLDYL